MANFNLFVDPKSGEKLIYDGNQFLVSEKKGTRYPVINNIPRFVSKELYDASVILSSESNFEEIQTSRSFGKKWQDDKISYIGVTNEFEKENLLEQFLALLGCENESELISLFNNAQRTLNGGCGIAWSEYLFNLNPECERHCVDLSLAVETAKKNTSSMKNVTISQSSILELPYEEETFDIVYSDGVVHHTPNPKLATQELGRRVRSGGTFGLYIYNIKPFIRELVDQSIRKITTKMSYEKCDAFSHSLSLLGKSFKDCSERKLNIAMDIPLLGIKKGEYDLQKFIYDHFIKCWYNPNATMEYADMVNLDWYHPSYASHHKLEEVIGWLKEIGFTNLKCLQPDGWEHSGYFISAQRTI